MMFMVFLAVCASVYVVAAVWLAFRFEGKR